MVAPDFCRFTDWETVLSAFVKCCTIGYSISIPSIALIFLVKLLLKFIYKVNLINHFFVTVLHAQTELVVSDHPKNDWNLL